MRFAVFLIRGDSITNETVKICRARPHYIRNFISSIENIKNYESQHDTHLCITDDTLL
jgi:hypothetical protein